MTNAAESPTKTRNQMARAHRLVAAIDSLRPGDFDNETRLQMAKDLDAGAWASEVAVIADHLADGTNALGRRFRDAPPSSTTIAMAIGILEARVAEDVATGRALAAAAGMDEPRRAADSQGYRGVMARIAPLPEDPFACFAGSDQR